MIEAFYTVPEAAQTLRLAERYVRYLLTRHADQFERRYRRIGRNSRRHRVLLTSDVQRLSELTLSYCIVATKRLKRSGHVRP